VVQGTSSHCVIVREDIMILLKQLPLPLSCTNWLELGLLVAKKIWTLWVVWVMLIVY
jgi:hypothetical protein